MVESTKSKDRVTVAISAHGNTTITRSKTNTPNPIHGRKHSRTPGRPSRTGANVNKQTPNLLSRNTVGMPEIASQQNLIGRNPSGMLPSYKGGANPVGMVQRNNNVRKVLTRSESTNNKIAKMLPLTGPTSYEVVVSKKLKKPLV